MRGASMDHRDAGESYCARCGVALYDDASIDSRICDDCDTAGARRLPDGTVYAPMSDDD